MNDFELQPEMLAQTEAGKQLSARNASILSICLTVTHGVEAMLSPLSLGGNKELADNLQICLQAAIFYDGTNGCRRDFPSNRHGPHSSAATRCNKIWCETPELAGSLCPGVFTTGQDIDYSTSLEWPRPSDLAAQSSNANAVSATTRRVVAPALRLAGTTVQRCTPPGSARPPLDVETVEDLTDRKAGIVWLDPRGPVRLPKSNSS
ncbi:hypothetical protein K3495_g12698 [Podosphaera aphanis]|nr:hypothetical protein K3495_g12698 [Podosphaera aphanis]